MQFPEDLTDPNPKCQHHDPSAAVRWMRLEQELVGQGVSFPVSRSRLSMVASGSTSVSAASASDMAP